MQRCIEMSSTSSYLEFAFEWNLKFHGSIYRTFQFIPGHPVLIGNLFNLETTYKLLSLNFLLLYLQILTDFSFLEITKYTCNAALEPSSEPKNKLRINIACNLN